LKCVKEKYYSELIFSREKHLEKIIIIRKCIQMVLTKKYQYKVLIVEDMLPAREQLIEYVDSRIECVVSDVARTGEQALEKLLNNTYDLLFLDIHLPDMTGIDMLQQVQKKPYVIFCTAYDTYAIKAFELGAIDYLLKPVHIDRFNQSIERFLQKIQSNEAQQNELYDTCLLFREKRQQCIVSYDDIIYISSNGKKTVIHTERRDFEVSELLKEVENRLPQEMFARIHKQFIVNLSYFEKIKHDSGGQYVGYINDSDDSRLPIGRSYVNELKKKISK